MDTVEAEKLAEKLRKGKMRAVVIDDHIVFRSGNHGQHSLYLPSSDKARVMAHWRGYCEINLEPLKGMGETAANSLCKALGPRWSPTECAWVGLVVKGVSIQLKRLHHQSMTPTETQELDGVKYCGRPEADVVQELEDAFVDVGCKPIEVGFKVHYITPIADYVVVVLELTPRRAKIQGHYKKTKNVFQRWVRKGELR